jgi:hypothetical protein
MNTNTNGRGHFDPSSFDEHPPALNGALHNLVGQWASPVDAQGEDEGKM